MEKAQTFAINHNNGAFKIPIGYRFIPTDEELVVHYLKRKAFSFPLPASIIPDLDVLQIDPFALQGDGSEKRYFFYKKKMVNGSVIDVAGQKRFALSGSGFWKPVGKGRLVVSGSGQTIVGIRKTLSFCRRKRFRDEKSKNSRWVLHEYHLVRSGPTPNSLHLISPMQNNECWVVCGLFQKKKRRVNNNEIMRKKKRIDKTDINSQQGPTMSSCSSGITDTDCCDDDDDDVDQQQQQQTSLINSCTRKP